MEVSWSETDMPGFRFHPTEEELLEFYLKGAVSGCRLGTNRAIGFLDIYQHDPVELPGLARNGEREWYFFVPRERSSSSCGKPKRTTGRGFWKATGSDRPVRGVADPCRIIGLKKTLVFYEGRAPRGRKTDWIMNEYRLPDAINSSQQPKGNVVLCKIYRKARSSKEPEKRVASEESTKETSGFVSSTSSMLPLTKETTAELEVEVEAEVEVSSAGQSRSEFHANLGMLEVPPRSELDWVVDPSMVRTPWFDHVSPCFANIFYF